MTYIKTFIPPPRSCPKRFGLHEKGLRGRPISTTLCGGCGHDSVGGDSITQACLEKCQGDARHIVWPSCSALGVLPEHQLTSWAIRTASNSVHGQRAFGSDGRQPGQPGLDLYGVYPADGDTAGVGDGPASCMRCAANLDRGVHRDEQRLLRTRPKGRDSGDCRCGVDQQIRAWTNSFQAIEPHGIGAGIRRLPSLARRFSGRQRRQLIPLIKAAISHHGFALIDVISPCVTFNNNTGSTKAYDYVREHMRDCRRDRLRAARRRDHDGSTCPRVLLADLTLHDGCMLQLHKTGTQLGSPR